MKMKLTHQSTSQKRDTHRGAEPKMNAYQYPLFFEARDLTDREKRKIWRHFQRRRDSGGGECSVIEKVEDDVYKVSFQESQDQQRVLQRKTHTISLPGGVLRLTMRETSLSQGQPLAGQHEAVTDPNARCLEKKFKPEVFLLYYLRDNPKAFKIFQKQLSSVGCTLELNCKQEEAVVQCDVEKGAARAFTDIADKWELHVDRIFFRLTANYLCHYVREPILIEKLRLDRSFVSDDIKVYKESDYAVVVVGETEAVKEKIAILEKFLPIQKELPVVERKFKLVEDEFKQEMSTRYPDVKVSRGTSNSIILEGPDEGVQSGAAKLDELIKKIKEKKVRLNTEILIFITTSGFASKYQDLFLQNLRCPVSLDIGSELLLSSLFSDVLYEAEETVLRDLSEASIQLHGAAAVPPDLTRVKEMLQKAKNEANRGEFRVDVRFISSSSGTPTTQVQLVGYTEQVNKLKDLLHDYQTNQILTQELINLQFPEMVDYFDKILKMVGMKQTKVILKVSHFPNPFVLLSGPLHLVKETQQALSSALASLTLDTLVLDGPGAQRYFQGDGKVSKELVESSFLVLIWQQDVYSKFGTINQGSINRPSSCTPRSHFNALGEMNKMNLEIKICSLEDEQVNVLVAPMLNQQLASTNIGTCLLQKGGSIIQSNFNSKAAICTLVPGDILEVDASSSLRCSKIFFIECMPWDGFTEGSVQALGNGLRRCLDLCVQQGFSSVAIPIIGPGAVFNYSLSKAVQVLTETIYEFGLSSGSGSLISIHIVIKPGHPDSEECYHEVYNCLRFYMNRVGQALFRPLTTDLDDADIIVGGRTKLKLVFGDIANETTDAVVNTTDFKNFYAEGVCRDILNKAGREVEAKLKAAKLNQGAILESKPGLFPCKALLHVRGENDAGAVEQLVCDIIKCCEDNGFTSVAMPAIRAGAGGMDPVVVAGAILRGIKVGTSSTILHRLATIRLVLRNMDLFLTFKHQAMQMFSPLTQVSQQLPRVQQSQVSGILNTSIAGQQSAFQFLGLSRKNVDDAMERFSELYDTQCSNHNFNKEDLMDLMTEDVLGLQQLVETEGLCVQLDPSGNLTVSGLKDGVSKMVMLMHDIFMRTKEENNLYTRVAWCIMGQNGNWERLPKTSNYKLEKQDIKGGIQDARGVLWQVDLKERKGTSHALGQSILKRVEHLDDFTFPLYWDSMAPGEVMKVVTLQPHSQEYQTVERDFKQTAHKKIRKIERLQNIHLRRAYEAQKKQLSDKNKNQGGEGEKLLYHGTTRESSDSIMKTGFNRRFAGQNATAYGKGTYFAVKASYSASTTYSRPAADGFQRMFLAKVLTGMFTQGQHGMKVPPPLDDRQPSSRYDSVVDNISSPGMFIVFHDDQAYPDYLITFN
nr:protein mono-ADP-ribosyltransferase PARP14 isoform X1 [Nothobranchius furzeri]